MGCAPLALATPVWGRGGVLPLMLVDRFVCNHRNTGVTLGHLQAFAFPPH